jgi:hypothetical protein
MQSLRSKSSAARKGPKPAAKLSKPDKNVRKSRVDDKIKKRMSTRYASISSPTPADATPSVPTIPLGLRGPDLDIIREKDEIAQQQAPSKEDLRVMENRLLDVEEFDPDACACVVLNFSILLPKRRVVLDLKLKLANSTEAELRSLQSSLQNSKDEVAADLQRNVFKKCVLTYSVPLHEP